MSCLKPNWAVPRARASIFVAGLLLAAFGPAQAAAAEPSASAPILCIGDSLTFGAFGDGVTYPATLAAKSGVPTVNMGLSGWIPRHIVYHVLLHELPAVSRQQLEGVPPAEYEERKNQPEINALRTFLTAGQTVWVKEEKIPVEYRWDPAAKEDDADTLKPLAVGDPAHHPLIATGRWRKLSTPAGLCPAPKVYRGIIFCVGANGMEADDVTRSLRTLLEVLAPARFLVLGLINRVDPDKHPEAIGHWAKCITECNEAIRTAYPDNFLEFQSWFMSTGAHADGGYRTRDWIKSATAEDVMRDRADQARGVLPFSLRAPANTTHLNGFGYGIVGTLAYEWTLRHGWYASPAK